MSSTPRPNAQNRTRASIIEGGGTRRVTEGVQKCTIDTHRLPQRRRGTAPRWMRRANTDKLKTSTYGGGIKMQNSSPLLQGRQKTPSADVYRQLPQRRSLTNASILEGGGTRRVTEGVPKMHNPPPSPSPAEKGDRAAVDEESKYRQPKT